MQIPQQQGGKNMVLTVGIVPRRSCGVFSLVVIISVCLLALLFGLSVRWRRLLQRIYTVSGRGPRRVRRGVHDGVDGPNLWCFKTQEPARTIRVSRKS